VQGERDLRWLGIWTLANEQVYILTYTAEGFEFNDFRRPVQQMTGRWRSSNPVEIVSQLTAAPALHEHAVGLLDAVPMTPRDPGPERRWTVATWPRPRRSVSASYLLDIDGTTLGAVRRGGRA